jgi:hypothetical protein
MAAGFSNLSEEICAMTLEQVSYRDGMKLKENFLMIFIL